MKYFITGMILAMLLSCFLFYGFYGLAQDIKGVKTQLNTIQIQTAGQYCAVYEIPTISRDPRLKGKPLE